MYIGSGSHLHIYNKHLKATEMGFHYENVSSNPGQSRVNNSYWTSPLKCLTHLKICIFKTDLTIFSSTSWSLTNSPRSCPEMWEPAFSLYTFNCQPNPTSCKLLNSDLLFSILTAITLVQAPISSRLDYCFISYFVHIQSIFCTIAIVLWLLSLLLKHPSISHLQYKFFINI